MSEEKEGFELSFKNKVVRVYFWLIVPIAIINIVLTLFTNVPSIVTSLLFIIILITFFIWLYFYQRKQKKKQETDQ